MLRTMQGLLVSGSILKEKISSKKQFLNLVCLNLIESTWYVFSNFDISNCQKYDTL